MATEIPIRFPVMAEQTVAGTHYERFWRLAQEANRAHSPEKIGNIGMDGFAHMMLVSVQRAVLYDMDTTIKITREARESIQRETFIDFWYDGYVAACDKVIYILQGGV